MVFFPSAGLGSRATKISVPQNRPFPLQRDRFVDTGAPPVRRHLNLHRFSNRILIKGELTLTATHIEEFKRDMFRLTLYSGLIRPRLFNCLPACLRFSRSVASSKPFVTLQPFKDGKMTGIPAFDVAFHREHAD